VSAVARPRRRRSRLLLALILLAGGVLLAEVAVRLRQWAVHGASSYYEFDEDPVSGLRIPRPGTIEGKSHLIHVNSRGFRGPEIEDPKPPGRVRVAFLGASTTFCAEASCDEATWPARLVASLQAAYPAHQFDGVNGGAAGYTSRESTLNLQKRIAPLQPDILVIYEGTNDLSHDTRLAAAAAGLPGGSVIGTSWLSRHSVAWELIEKNLRAARPAADTGALTLSLDTSALESEFHANLTREVEAAKQLARTVVLVSFAHQQRREQPREAQRAAAATSLLWMPYMSLGGVLDGFDAWNRAVRRVAQEQGCVLVEGEDGIPGDRAHFADSVHFTDEGCRLQAQRVLEVLLVTPQLAWLRQDSM
jgi:lysophospholipase L1-like esterase